MREDFELKLATVGSASRRISFVGLSTPSVLYAVLPPSEEGLLFCGENADSRSSAKPPSLSASLCGCAMKKDLTTSQSCLSCCFQSLPRLAGERGLLDAEVFSDPSPPKTESQLAASKATSLPTAAAESNQSLELFFKGARTEAKTKRNTEGAEPLSLDAAKEADEQRSSETDGETRSSEYFIGESLSSLQQTPDSRVIVLGAAWPPGKRRQCPFASNKVECAGNFEVTVEPSPYSNWFSFEPARGQLFLGKRQFVVVSVSPPPEGSSKIVHSSIPLEKTPVQVFRRSKDSAFLCVSISLSTSACDADSGSSPDGLPPNMRGSSVIEAAARLWLRPTGTAGGSNSQEIAIRLSALIE